MSAVSESPAIPVPAFQRAGIDRAVPLARGAIAIGLGLAITFSLDHSARFGLVSFAVFALATGGVLALGAILDGRIGSVVVRSGDRLSVLLAVLALIAGAVALLVEDSLFVAIASSWALLTGATELTAGLSARRAGRPGSDAILRGALTILLAMVLLVVPPDFVEPWQVLGREGEVEASGAVTADVMTVGILGAWAVIHGVLLVISALSPRAPIPGTPAPRAAEPGA